jgi:hypothetical protein
MSEPKPIQTIHRRKLVADFTVLPNALLREKTLSFKARGIAAMMLSNADGWITNMGWLESQGTEGREAIRSAVQELEAAGYAVFSLQKGDGGVITANTWTWYDLPVPMEQRSNRTRWNEREVSKNSNIPCDGKPLHGENRETGLPCDGKPTDGKPATKKNKVKKDNQKKKDDDSAAELPEFPKSKIKEIWNARVTSLPAITGIHGKREKLLRARWDGMGGMIESWSQFCDRIEASDFMTGRAPGTDGRKWTASFDWCIIPGNADKIHEGKYDNKLKPKTEDERFHF